MFAPMKKCVAGMPFEVKKLYNVGELSYTFRININAVNAQCHFRTYR